MDGEALIELWTPEHYVEVDRLARQEARRQHVEVEDARQEILLDLLSRPESHASASASRFTVYRLARAAVRELGRRDRLHRRRAAREAQGRFEKRAVDPDVVMDVRAAVESIRPIDAEVITGRYFEYRSFAELAEASGRTANGVRMRQHLAYAALRGGLEAAYGRRESRVRSTPRRVDTTSVRGRTGSKIDWSRWGPIPNQRKDDDDA